MVHIRPADRAGKMCLELFDCEMDTSIRELKQKVRFFQIACPLYLRITASKLHPMQIEDYGETSGRYTLPWTAQVPDICCGMLIYFGDRDPSTFADGWF